MGHRCLTSKSCHLGRTWKGTSNSTFSHHMEVETAVAQHFQ